MGDRGQEARRVAGDIASTAAALLLTMLLGALAIVANASMLGRAQPSALYVLALFLPLSQIVAAVHEGLRVVCLRYIARADSDGDRDLLGPKLLALLSMVLALIAGLALGVLLARGWIAQAYSVPSARQAQAFAFAMEMLGASVVIGWATLLLSALFGLGHTRAATALSLLATALNVLVAALAIEGWGLGMNGLVVAVIAGSGFACAGAIALLRWHGIRPRLGLAPKFLGCALRDASSSGAPVALSLLLLSAYLFAFGHMVARYGAAEMAGFGVSMRIQFFIFLPAIAIGTATALCANRSTASSRRVVRVGLLLSLIAYVLLSATLFILRAGLIELFTSDQTVADAALRYLERVVPSYLGFGPTLTLLTVLEQSGHALGVLLLNAALYGVEIGAAFWLGAGRADAQALYMVAAGGNWLSGALALGAIALWPRIFRASALIFGAFGEAEEAK